MHPQNLKSALLVAAFGLGLSGAAQATLHDRGSGLVYDDVLNITWLQDANYAKTSGRDSDGLMDWNAADSWAQTLHYVDVNGHDYSGFRLAANQPVAGGGAWTSQDAGYSVASPRTELGYMYYVNLGLKSMLSATGVYQPDYGIHRLGASNGQTDIGLVKNLQSGLYWSGTSFGSDVDGQGTLAWSLNTTIGYQALFTIAPVPQGGGVSKSYEFYAWVVHDGDIVGPSPVPELGTPVLLAAGLGLVAWVSARRKRW
jgi:hypothetical protein